MKILVTIPHYYAHDPQGIYASNGDPERKASISCSRRRASVMCSIGLACRRACTSEGIFPMSIRSFWDGG